MPWIFVSMKNKKDSQLRIGLLQYSISSEFEDNILSVFSHLKKIKSKSLDYLVLPEMWLGGPREVADRDRWHKKYKLALEKIREWCVLKKCGVYFSQIEKSKSQFYNTAYLIESDGKILKPYRKMHLFGYGGESQLFDSGKYQQPWKSRHGRVGGVICYDLRFPEQLRQLVIQGAKLIFVCAQWPQSRAEHWKTLLKARAIENQCYILASNRLGKKGVEAFQGDSMVIDPWGQVLLQLKKNQNYGEVVIDLQEVTRIRAQFPFLQDFKFFPF